MLLVQLRKTLCNSTYVEIIRPALRRPEAVKAVYSGEACKMPVMYDNDRVGKIGTSVNRCGNPEILIMLEY